VSIDSDYDAPVYVPQGAKIEQYTHVHMVPSDECIKKRRGPKCSPILSAMYRELDRLLILADAKDAVAREAEESTRRKRAEANGMADHNVALRKAILTMEGASEAAISRVPTMNRRRLAAIKAGEDRVSGDG
jgi:hypothetical protein